MTPAEAFEAASEIGRVLARRFPTVRVDVLRPLDPDHRAYGGFTIGFTEDVGGHIAYRYHDFPAHLIEQIPTRELLENLLVVRLEDFLT